MSDMQTLQRLREIRKKAYRFNSKWVDKSIEEVERSIDFNLEIIDKLNP